MLASGDFTVIARHSKPRGEECQGAPGVIQIVTTAETDRTTPPSGKGARVIFDVHRDVALEPDVAWEALIDWAAHSDWVPLTHVNVDFEPQRLYCMVRARRFRLGAPSRP